MKSDKTIYRMFLLQHEQALLKMRKQTSLSPWGVNSLFFRCQTTLKKKRNLKRVWCFKYSWNTLRRTFTFVALSQRFVFECHKKIDSFCKSWIAIFIFSKIKRSKYETIHWMCRRNYIHCVWIQFTKSYSHLDTINISPTHLEF